MTTPVRVIRPRWLMWSVNGSRCIGGRLSVLGAVAVVGALVVPVGAAILAQSQSAAAAASTWTITPSATPTGGGWFNSISCITSSDCVAVGGGANGTLAETWNGTSWSVQSTSSPGSYSNVLNSVSCISSTFCVAVGDYDNSSNGSGGTVFAGDARSLVETYNGTAWSVVPSPNPGTTTQGVGADYMEDNNLYGVTCLTSSWCMAVGTYDSTGSWSLTPMIQSWDGTTWSVVSSPLTSGAYNNGLSGISCLSTSWCIAVGLAEAAAVPSSTLIEQWNGSTWSIVPSPNPGTEAGTNTGTGLNNDLDSVSCTTISSCIAVGYYFTPSVQHTLVESWNGASWSVVSSPNPGPVDELYGVSCTSVSACVAVGEEGESNQGGGVGSPISQIIETWDGSAWEQAQNPASLPSDNWLENVACLSSTCQAVGGSYNGTSNSTLVETGTISSQSTSGPGYWMLGSDGTVYPFGSAASLGSATSLGSAVAIASLPNGSGYWVVNAFGFVDAFGSAQTYSLSGSPTSAVVAIASTPDGGGYWLATSTGQLLTAGDAQNFGNAPASLNSPIVNMAVTPDGKGYWLLGGDGGVFTFGDATFYGSTGNMHLDKPAVAMAPTADGKGYWFVASDGGVFNFGDAVFYGSTGQLNPALPPGGSNSVNPLDKPANGMVVTPDGKGYWVAASDGGVFTFGDAGFVGSLGGQSIPSPIVGFEPASL